MHINFQTPSIPVPSFSPYFLLLRSKQLNGNFPFFYSRKRVERLFCIFLETLLMCLGKFKLDGIDVHWFAASRG